MDTRDLLDRLADGSTVSGEALAEEFDVSRNAVWKHVERLRESGFEVASGSDGYHLEAVPEYGGFALAHHLDAARIGRDVDYREEVDSTNAVAQEAAREGAREGTVVLADRQTAGSGRRGRVWDSPSGGLWMSLVLRPELSPRRASVITLAASVAVARALEDLGLDPSIKWPNDVLLGDAKVCGILVELQADAEAIDHAVVGIGLNANAAPDVPDADVTSVREALGEPVNRAALAARILEHFEALYTDSATAVLDQWRKRSSTIGRDVRVTLPDETIEGEAVGVDDTGALRVATADGERVVAAGDCEHLR